MMDTRPVFWDWREAVNIANIHTHVSRGLKHIAVIIMQTATRGTCSRGFEAMITSEISKVDMVSGQEDGGDVSHYTISQFRHAGQLITSSTVLTVLILRIDNPQIRAK